MGQVFTIPWGTIHLNHKGDGFSLSFDPINVNYILLQNHIYYKGMNTKTKINSNYLNPPDEIKRLLGVPEDIIEREPTWEEFTKETETVVYSCHPDSVDALIYYKMNIDSIFRGEERREKSLKLEELIEYFGENCICYHK